MNVKNSEGYHDPTAYNGLKTLIKAEGVVDKKAYRLIEILKATADLAGFEFIGRVQLRHKKSGREFK